MILYTLLSGSFLFQTGIPTLSLVSNCRPLSQGPPQLPNTQPRANSSALPVDVDICVDDCMLDYQTRTVVSSVCNWNLRCLARVLLSPTAKVIDNLPSHQPPPAPIANHRNTTRADVRPKNRMHFCASKGSCPESKRRQM